MLPFSAIQPPGDLVTIAKILSQRGIHGELKILPLTDSPDRFENLGKVFLCDEGENRTYIAEIENVRIVSRKIILKFFEIDEIRTALLLRGWYVKIRKCDCPELSDGRYYVYDLIGLSVYSTGNIYLGTVKDVWTLASNDVFVVEHRDGEHLIPAVREIVREIDLEKERIVIDPIEGLLD